MTRFDDLQVAPTGKGTALTVVQADGTSPAIVAQSAGQLMSLRNTGGTELMSVSQAGVVDVTTLAVGGVVVHAHNEPHPEAHGLVSWNGDVATCGNSTILTTSGTVYLFRMDFSATATITGVGFWVTVAGATLTSGQCFTGLYSSAGTRLAVSATAHTAFTGTGWVAPAFTAATTVQGGSYAYGAILMNGTTMPTLAAGSGLAGIGNLNLTAGGGARFLAGPAGQATLPASITLSAQSLTGAATWWCGAY